MAILASYPLVYEQGASFVARVLTYYPGGVVNGVPVGAPFNWTGWTAIQTFRPSAESVGSPIAALSVVLGGMAGTVTIPGQNVADVEALYALIRQGVYDIVCTRTADGFAERFIDVSQFIITPGCGR